MDESPRHRFPDRLFPETRQRPFEHLFKRHACALGDEPFLFRSGQLLETVLGAHRALLGEEASDGDKLKRASTPRVLRAAA